MKILHLIKACKPIPAADDKCQFLLMFHKPDFSYPALRHSLPYVNASFVGGFWEIYNSMVYVRNYAIYEKGGGYDPPRRRR